MKSSRLTSTHHNQVSWLLEHHIVYSSLQFFSLDPPRSVAVFLHLVLIELSFLPPVLLMELWVQVFCIFLFFPPILTSFLRHLFPTSYTSVSTACIQLHLPIPHMLWRHNDQRCWLPKVPLESAHISIPPF